MNKRWLMLFIVPCLYPIYVLAINQTSEVPIDTEANVVITQECSPEIPDIIFMKSDYKHKKAIVKFDHSKHLNDLELACGECHHRGADDPLTEEEATNGIQTCITCHQNPGKAPRGLKGKEAREYHANALHDNCVSCHKETNKRLKNKKAPKSCKKCHKKDKKKTAAIEGC